jgi:hypothetical protein
MAYLRKCTRLSCGKLAVATLTYVYADSTAVALANAVREAAKPQPDVWSEPAFANDYANRSHLRIVRDEN